MRLGIPLFPRVWFATMYGVGDSSLWGTLPAKIGLDAVRITDVISTELADTWTDPEDKFGEVAAKIQAYRRSRLRYIHDLSYVRNRVADKAKEVNAYASETAFDAYRRVIEVYRERGWLTDPSVLYIAIAGEPEGPGYGARNDRPPTFAHLCEFYARVAEMLRQAGYRGPITTGGPMNFGDEVSGLDMHALIDAPWNQVPTVHIYEAHDLALVPDLVDHAHRVGKPLIVEEVGVQYGKEQGMRLPQTLSDLVAAGVDGIGLWNLGSDPDHPDSYNLTAGMRSQVAGYVLAGRAADRATHRYLRAPWWTV